MKKIAILFLLSGFYTFSIAQRWITPEQSKFVPYYDVRFGVGIKPFEAAYAANNFLNFGMMVPPINDLIGFETKDYYNGARYTTNVLYCEYIYQANKLVGVGATLTYFAYFNDYLDAVSDAKVGSNTIHHISLYPTIRFSWINNSGFSMYSSFGIGPRQVFEINDIRSNVQTSSRNSFGCQLTLLGLTIGKNFYCFSDFITIGTQGILTGGVGYRFTNRK